VQNVPQLIKVIKPNLGFDDVINRVAGDIPVIGTVKDIIEAGIEETGRHYAEAKEKVFKAGLDIVSDIVTVATFGTGAEVAFAGKTAAENTLIQAADGASKTSAMATSLGLGEKAAAVLTAADDARTAKRQASRRKKRKQSPVQKEPPIAKKRKEPRSDSPTAADASASKVRIGQRKEQKEPKQGHHVINKGVKKIFHDIIKKFFEGNRDTIFGKNCYQDLVDTGIINPDKTPNLMRSYPKSDPPLSTEVATQIDEMVAYTPPGEIHTDENDANFGVSKVILLRAVWQIILSVFTSLRDNKPMPDLSTSGTYLDQMETLIDVIAAITEEATGQHGVYVDKQALNWWLTAGPGRGKEEQFTKCINEVREMLNSLPDITKPSHELGIASIWGKEIFYVHSRLISPN